MAIPQKKVLEYLANGGSACPYCGSEEIQGIFRSYSSEGLLFFKCECFTCLHEWEEQYTLTNITPHESMALEESCTLM